MVGWIRLQRIEPRTSTPRGSASAWRWFVLVMEDEVDPDVARRLAPRSSRRACSRCKGRPGPSRIWTCCSARTEPARSNPAFERQLGLVAYIARSASCHVSCSDMSACTSTRPTAATLGVAQRGGHPSDQGVELPRWTRPVRARRTRPRRAGRPGRSPARPSRAPARRDAGAPSPCGVTLLVVYGLEPVQVDDHHTRRRAVAATACLPPLDARCSRRVRLGMPHSASRCGRRRARPRRGVAPRPRGARRPTRSSATRRAARGRAAGRRGADGLPLRVDRSEGAEQLAVRQVQRDADVSSHAELGGGAAGVAQRRGASEVHDDGRLAVLDDPAAQGSALTS